MTTQWRTQDVGTWAARATLLAAVLLAAPLDASAQLSALISPGRLSEAHTGLEGLTQCSACHEPGQGVTADRCLTCHEPIAERITAGRGVHRDVTDDCVACHVEHAGLDGNIRPFDAGQFDHLTETAFPLDGLHAPVECTQCHETRSFLIEEPTCAGCHTDVHEQQLGNNCAACHTTDVTFDAAATTFDHTPTAFPLAGAHQTVDCASCHSSEQFPPIEFESCATCHETPHDLSFSSTCESCHTSQSWQTQTIDHDITEFPLLGSHATLDCVSCHVEPAMDVPLEATRCADCHVDPHQSEFEQKCSVCHAEDDFSITPFDHAAETTFALTEGHRDVTCVSCHIDISTTGPLTTRIVDFRGVGTECAACHTDVHEAELGPTCDSCHTTRTFEVHDFTHTTTPELFRGEHEGLSCVSCHVTHAPERPTRTGEPIDAWTFTDTPSACAACHVDPHLGQLGTTCESCHRVDAPDFAAPAFTHSSTDFPLDGQHAVIECAACHDDEVADFPEGPGTAIRFTDLPTDCVACHQDSHLGQLGDRCERCHTADTFQLTSYTHQNQPDLMDGEHAALSCVDCHLEEEGVFPSHSGVAVRYTEFDGCRSCHLDTDVHDGAVGTDCESCHDVGGWEEPSRAFHQTAQFPLDGQHMSVPCASCHIDGVLSGTPTACFDCHWSRQQDDRYALSLGEDCSSCHQPSSWVQTNWDHQAETGVPLDPTHRLLGCDSCHQDQTFAGGVSLDCVGCHQSDFDRTTEPNHLAAGFPTTCDICHRPASPTWNQASFGHSTFVLRGAHMTVDCVSCHVNDVYQGTPRNCVGCHLDDYQQTQTPNHANAGFPTACVNCHQASATSWQGAEAGDGFNHNAVFPLRGQHNTLDCASCHINDIYAGTPRDCVGCHLDDYQQTQDPNHANAGFPTTCDSCHEASDPNWLGATFNHNAVFPLQGQHNTLDCASCHINDVYAGTPRDCVGCHLDDYQQTQDPNHTAANFPTTCDSCHQASDPNWFQGTFDHQFPINNGAHKNATCAQCHIDPGNYAIFSCLTCHEHNENDMNDKHDEENGYVYESLACYSCHPNGTH